MYCPKCGTQNDDDNKFCMNCGAGLTHETSTQQSMPTPQPIPVIQQVVPTNRTSGLAIAALVLGIIGLIINFLGILAIIFGAIAVSQTGKDSTLGGRGMAIAGLVLGIIAIAIWILIIIFLNSASPFFWNSGEFVLNPGYIM